MALVEIALFTTRSEAEVAAASLRALGIQAVTFDEGIGAAAYYVGLSGKGFRVLAPESEKQDAIELLRQMQDAPPDEE